MLKIAKSLMMIGVVAALAIGVTGAFFSDTETSTGNTFTAGTIDISVAGQNPWNTVYPMELDKPCETNYINFTIRNVGENPANVWKRINNVATNGGDSSFCSVASSEPEYVEGGGTFDSNGDCVSGTYIEENNLAAYMIYDMYICHGAVGSTECPMLTDDLATAAPDLSSGTGWTVIIPESNQIRIDNVNGIWIKLDDELAKNGALAVSQSYHLMAWDDAGVETITNWAQGDVMTFDIELEARQLTAPAPGSENGMASVILREKNPKTWIPIVSGAMGTMTYNTSGTEFKYNFDASGLQNINYSLIYYADDWPGNNPGALLGTFTASGGVIDVSDHVATGVTFDLPDSNDANYPVGAKIWLIPSTSYDASSHSVTNWGSAGSYLFEMNLIKYDKN